MAGATITLEDEVVRRVESAVAVLDSRVCDMSTDVKKIREVVIEGNGEPSLKEQVHSVAKWQQTVNKLIWIVVGAVVVQMITMGCSFTVLVAVMLQNDPKVTALIVRLMP